MREGDYRVYRNTCPRKCYSSCSILSYVKKGKLKKVMGDPNHGYSLGRLCAQGYALPQSVYHPDRLRYPMLQEPRGSGCWSRISWDEALNIIAGKILALNSSFNNNLGLGFYKGAGNMGLLQKVAEGFFETLGARTLSDETGGNVRPDLSQLEMPEPECMARAKHVVLWGVNPAVNGVQQIFFINRARDFRGKMVVIDPVFTPTAAQGDVYLQIMPGTDGLLAMAVAKLLVEKGKVNEDFLLQNTEGWSEYKHYLMDQVSLDRVARETGVGMEAIKKLARCYSNQRVATWIGGSLLGEASGDVNTVQAIEALAVLSGQVGSLGGGVYYGWHNQRQFSPQELLELKDPPLRLLWFTGADSLKGNSQSPLWQKLSQQLDLIVTTDLFLTETATCSDIVLPAASVFEEYDLYFSDWHQWVSINEKALPDYYEAKSDLEIVRMLTSKLNEISPGFSGFPHELSPVDWLRKKLTPEIKSSLGISHWRDLVKSPRKPGHRSRCKQGGFSSIIPPFYRFDIGGNRAN